MSHGSPQGGYKLVLVPADSIEETAASRERGEAYVAARHGYGGRDAGTRTIMGPFEVIADVGPDRKIRMSRLVYEQVEVIG